jgi:hypothetical protein
MFLIVSLLSSITFLVSCSPDLGKVPVDPYRNNPASTPTLTTPSGYLSRVSIDPTRAKYFDMVKKSLSLNSDELTLLESNGFVVTDRLAWDRFVDAYAWIYAEDLPVLITTDSILHSVHQSYDDLLIDIERAVLLPDLNSLLIGSHAAVDRSASENNEKGLDQLYKDVSTYLSVAIGLLNGKEPADKSAQPYFALAVNAGQIAKIDLFGNTREIDFTLFKPRGHYAEDPDLQQYFRSMSWLAQIDFRFVEFNKTTSKPVFHRNQVLAAAILRQAIDSSSQRETWNEMNQLLEALIGRSDNTALPDFDALMADMGLSGPADILKADETHMLDLLLSGKYGDQRITGQILYRDAANSSDQPVPRPVSFLLIGQRFAIDSYVLGDLVYDRMIKDGKPIFRALPSTLDAMYALGNDRALSHLQDELTTYQYDRQLAEMRATVDSLPSDFWQAPAYNQWLSMIRALNNPTTGDMYPQSIRTVAWADKMLQTQLASWAQLRHDNVLYVKQSVTMGIACEYPEGYVEPYPEFYSALSNYAEMGYQAVSQVAGRTVGVNASGWEYIKKKALNYFNNVKTAADQLNNIVEKELALKEFSADEETFLKSVVVRHRNDNQGCGGPEFVFDGWYVNLFYNEDESPSIIVDVHTNPNNDGPLAPARVLHAATGSTVPLCLIADTDEGATAYVGPSFTYYDVIETGYPPVRLTDKDWQSRLDSQDQPSHPVWTQSFIAISGNKPELLTLGK